MQPRDSTECSYLFQPLRLLEDAGRLLQRCKHSWVRSSPCHPCIHHAQLSCYHSPTPLTFLVCVCLAPFPLTGTATAWRSCTSARRTPWDQSLQPLPPDAPHSQRSSAQENLGSHWTQVNVYQADTGRYSLGCRTLECFLPVSGPVMHVDIHPSLANSYWCVCTAT
jgi:hypothetical protein